MTMVTARDTLQAQPSVQTAYIYVANTKPERIMALSRQTGKQKYPDL